MCYSRTVIIPRMATTLFLLYMQLALKNSYHTGILLSNIIAGQEFGEEKWWKLRSLITSEPILVAFVLKSNPYFGWHFVQFCTKLRWNKSKIKSKESLRLIWALLSTFRKNSEIVKIIWSFEPWPIYLVLMRKIIV